MGQNRDDQDDPFAAWLDQMSDLSPRELGELPGWQRHLAVVHQFALESAGDGAASLFYNSSNEEIGGVVSALEALGEQELVEKLRAIRATLEAANPSDEAEYLMGPALQDAEELNALLDRRWDALYTKIEERARANGWKP